MATITATAVCSMTVNLGRDNATATESARNQNYVLQMPSDGLALNTMRQYATKDSSGNITALNLPDTETLKNNVHEYLDNYLIGTSVGRLFFNVNYTRSMVPSATFDTAAYDVGITVDGTIDSSNYKNIDRPSAFADVQYYWYTLNQGIDVIGYGIDYANTFGVEAWASVRMNDHHYPTDPGINASFRYAYASTWGVNGSSMFMDYTVPAVQTCYLNYIKELATNYDIYGVELDFLRTAPYMSTVDAENIQILNDFVKRVREEVSAIGKAKTTPRDIKVAVRVYAQEKTNLDYGMDVAQWVADGSVQVVTVANYYQPTSFDLPIKEWRESIDGKNIIKHDYAILGGLDWAIKGNPYLYMVMTPAHTRGFTSAAYANGADGIYLFNMFYIDGVYATEYTVNSGGAITTKNIFNERMMASDSLKSAESGLRRYTFSYFSTYFDYDASTPRVLNAHNTTAFKMQTGTAPETGYYMVTLGLDGAYDGYDENLLTVTLNGKTLTQIGDMPRSSSLNYIDTTTERGMSHITQSAHRFVQFVVSDLSIVKDGHNVINVINRSGKQQKIRWVEVFVDGTDGAKPVVTA